MERLRCSRRERQAGCDRESAGKRDRDAQRGAGLGQQQGGGGQ